MSLKPDDPNVPSAVHAAADAQVLAPAVLEQQRVLTHGDLCSETSEPSLILSEVNFEPLDPRIVTAERISNWIFVACVAVGGLVAQIIYGAADWPPGFVSGAIAVGYLILLAFLVWAGHFYPARAYRHAAWRLTGQGLEIRRGVWWKHEITIPRARVQHTDVHQGPLQRKFGLARLVIHTAGTHKASITLDGLAFETAQKLRSALVAECIARTTPREAP